MKNGCGHAHFLSLQLERLHFLTNQLSLPRVHQCNLECLVLTNKTRLVAAGFEPTTSQNSFQNPKNLPTDVLILLELARGA